MANISQDMDLGECAGKDDECSAGKCQKHEKCQLHCTIINLKTQKLEMEKSIKDLKATITDTESKNIEQRKEIDKLQKQMNENENIVKKANAEIRDCMEKKSKIESIQQELISSVTNRQINQACQKAENVFGNSPSPDELIDKVIHSKATVHATTEVNGEKRYAQLMVKDGDVHLPAFASCNGLPTPNNTIAVSSLLSRYTSTSVFMTLVGISDGKKLGTVYFKLRANNFAKFTKKLCMGTIVPCYRGCLFKIKHPYYLRTGDLDNVNSVTGEVPQEGQIGSGAVLVKRGMVYSKGPFILGFAMCDWSGGYACAVGDVSKGMSVVEEAHTYPPGAVIIIDVGIVLTDRN